VSKGCSISARREFALRAVAPRERPDGARVMRRTPRKLCAPWANKAVSPPI